MGGFLVAVTVMSIGICWPLERARRRGRAIDALYKIGNVIYQIESHDDEADDDDDLELGLGDHFWLDLKRVPVDVVAYEFSARIASQIVEARPVHVLRIYYSGEQQSLTPLRVLNEGCEVILIINAELSQDDLQRAKQALPGKNVKIVYGMSGP
jgi:hypothetical protein